ncbi:MAG: carboxypeptidase-like regulatory domain-containing protein [Planctomycetota bacterium]
METSRPDRASVFGWIFDAETSTGIAGAFLTLGESVCESARDGSFELERGTSWDRTLRVDHLFYAAELRRSIPPDGELGVLFLRRGGAIEGEVALPEAEVDADLAAIVRCRLREPRDPADESEREVVSVPLIDGHFTVPALSAGVWELRALSSACSPSASVEVEVAPGIVSRAHLELGPAGALEGVVRDRFGASYARAANVRLYYQSDAAIWNGGEALYHPVEDGRFRIDGLPAGSYLLELLSEPDQFGEMTVEIRPGVTKVVEISELPPGEIQGQVVDSRSAPVPGATVRSSWLRNPRSASAGETALADEQGMFVVPAVDGEDYELVVAKPGYVPAAVTVTAGIDAPPIRLSRAASISGRIVGAGERPVKGARVDARSRRGPMPENIASSLLQRIRADGSFELSGIPPGVVLLVVGSESHLPADLELTLAEGEDRQDVVIRLNEGGFIAGTLRLGEGQPLEERCSVAVDPEIFEGFDRRTRLSAMSDEHGAFRVGPLPESRYAFRIGGRTFRLVSDVGLVSVLSGNTTEIDPFVERRHQVTLKGRVCHADGSPTGATDVRLELSGQTWTAALDETGRFTFEEVWPGDGTLEATALEDYPSRASTKMLLKRVFASRDITISNEELQEVSLEIEAAPLLLDVLILQDGEPLGGRYVEFVAGKTSGGFPYSWTVTDEAGRGTLECLSVADGVLNIAGSDPSPEPLGSVKLNLSASTGREFREIDLPK